MTIAASMGIAAEKPADLARAAQRAELRGDKLQAFLLYSRAAKLDPENAEYRIHRDTLQSTPGFYQAGAVDEESRLEELLAEDAPLVPLARDLLPPVSLRAAAGQKSFNLTGDAKTIFTKVASDFGIEAVFEPDYQGPPNFKFVLDSVTYAEAFRALELV